MNRLSWTDSLAAPRSLATRSDLSVAIIEDPGIVDLRFPIDEYTWRTANAALEVELPREPWQTVWIDGMRYIWTGPGRWRVIGPRHRIGDLIERLRHADHRGAVTELTGALSCFRIAGSGAAELLMRVCPLALGPINRDEARGTSIAGIPALIVREASSVGSWLILAPRSYAEYVGLSLVEAARTPNRLRLFEPASPPLV